MRKLTYIIAIFKMVSKIMAEEEISFDSNGRDSEVIVITFSSLAICTNISGINITVESLFSAENVLLTRSFSSSALIIRLSCSIV